MLILQTVEAMDVLLISSHLSKEPMKKAGEKRTPAFFTRSQFNQHLHQS
jgi:hypothetical protein